MQLPLCDKAKESEEVLRKPTRLWGGKQELGGLGVIEHCVGDVFEMEQPKLNFN